MKAKVQYNDFVGSAAADISDNIDLERYLSSKGVDIKKYEAIGASFYSGYSSFFSLSIICIDKDKSTDEKQHLVSITFDEEISRDEFFELFKRFNVVISKKYGNYNHLEIDEEIHIDNED